MLCITVYENQVFVVGGMRIFVRKNSTNQYRVFLEGPRDIEVDRTEDYMLPPKEKKIKIVEVKAK